MGDKRRPVASIALNEFVRWVSNLQQLSGAPLALPSGRAPAWIQTDEAPEIASRFMNEISGMGYAVLRHLITNARKETVRLTPDEYAAITEHPNGKSGVAGVLGALAWIIASAVGILLTELAGTTVLGALAPAITFVIAAGGAWAAFRVQPPRTIPRVDAPRIDEQHLA